MDDLRLLLYEALSSEGHGIKVQSASSEALRQKLYKLRNENLLEFESLTFILSPFNPERELWILRKAAPNGKE